MSQLEINNIKKSFEMKNSILKVLDNVNFNVKDKEFLCIIGPSGCGKTTLLKLIAGLLKNDDGYIKLNENLIEKSSEKIGLVFQDHACFPWLTVRDNIAFGLKLQNIDEGIINRKVSHFIEVTNLKGFENVYANKLSLGMKQRVAIARTLANNPDVILMDEPFGSLDAQTRENMQKFLLKVWEENKKTIIFVTHDIDEAIFLADRILVMSQRPAKIIKEYEIDFARPRNNELFKDERFFSIKEEIRQSLDYSKK